MKFEGAGSVTLNGPWASFLIKVASWPYLLHFFRSCAPPASAVLPSTPPPGPFHSTATLSETKPSTASAMSVSHEPRRISPSLKMSNPKCRCFSRASRIARSSSARSSSSLRRPSACAARARNNSGGRRRLPTCSARNLKAMVGSLNFLESNSSTKVVPCEKWRQSIGNRRQRQELHARLSGSSTATLGCAPRRVLYNTTAQARVPVLQDPHAKPRKLNTHHSLGL